MRAGRGWSLLICCIEGSGQDGEGLRAVVFSCLRVWCGRGLCRLVANGSEVCLMSVASDGLFFPVDSRYLALRLDLQCFGCGGCGVRRCALVTQELTGRICSLRLVNGSVKFLHP